VKKILYIVSTLKKCGPSNQLFNIISNLDKNKFEVLILTLSSEPKRTMIDEFIDFNINVETINLSRIQGLYLSSSRVNDVIVNFKPDIIHTQGFRADWVSSKIKNFKGIRVNTIRNFPQIDFPMTYGAVMGLFMVNIQIRAIKKSDYVIGVSSSVSENLIMKYKLANVKTITNGVDTNQYYPLDILTKNKLRKKYNIPKTKKVFIMSGHLNKRKNPLEVASVFKNDDVILIYLGSGELASEIKKLTLANSNIKYFGLVDDVKDYLRMSDYVISSSISEGYPNSILEAMACGLPPLLSNISPHVEILDLNNSLGFSYELHNNISLEENFNNLIKLNYDELRSEVLNTTDKYLSAKVMSEKYQNIYEM
jgi:glycosyltransferase involved in cell wall biosynthesis